LHTHLPVIGLADPRSGSRAENNGKPKTLKRAGSGIVADMINHRSEVGLKLRKKLGNFIKPLSEGIQARPQSRTAGPVAGMPRMAFEHPVKMFRLPTESHRQGFKRATAPPALNRVPLDFPHDSCRDMRTLRELALTPAKLTDTITDSPSDRSPVPGIAFRHAFPPRSTSSAETSRSPGDSAPCRDQLQADEGIP
jgi:hypothetical protein